MRTDRHVNTHFSLSISHSFNPRISIPMYTPCANGPCLDLGLWTSSNHIECSVVFGGFPADPKALNSFFQWQTWSFLQLLVCLLNICSTITLHTVQSSQDQKVDARSSGNWHSYYRDLTQPLPRALLPFRFKHTFSSKLNLSCSCRLVPLP